MSENIFADDWHECLEAHYMHVVRTEDRVTLPSLTVVMQQAGFSQSELAELRVRATMHVDKVSTDFVPDLEILEESDPAVAEANDPAIFAVPDMPEAAAVDEVPVLDEAPVEEDEPEPENIIEPVIEEPPQEDPDAPQQLSLF